MVYRANEMYADFISGSGTENVSPELLVFLARPRIGALVDRNDEPGDSAQDLEELGFCGFHSFEGRLSLIRK